MHYICVINHRFGSIPMHVHRKKQRMDISNDTLDGNPTEFPEGNAESETQGKAISLRR